MRLPWIHATLHLVLGCQISYPLSNQKNKRESRELSLFLLDNYEIKKTVFF